MQINYRIKVLDIYPTAKVHKSVGDFWIANIPKRMIFYEGCLPAFQILINHGPTQKILGKGGSPNKAWKNAWVSIQHEMINSLAK